MHFIARLEKPKKLGFFERWLLSFKFKVIISYRDYTDLLISAEKLFYKVKIAELTNEIESNMEILKKYNKVQINKELKDLCRILFNNSIRNHYQNHNIMEFDKGSYKKDFRNFLRRFPVVLSTSHSLLNNAPQGFIFDYLIIDEAPGDLLSCVLAMSCAKNLVVVGDSDSFS